MSELKTIESLDRNPFKCMVATIGNLPTSFVDSMSYYELLAWLCQYLKDTVIPTVNNNAEAVEELQALYIELHDYVENYFDNLDVQEEINNKLDDMAERGQLADIISQYLNSTAIFGFDTVADLKLADNLVNGSFARTLGFHAKGDGGGALYKIRNITNDDTVDESFIIEMTADPGNNLIAELIYGSQVDITTFGCTTDTTLDIDNASLINYAIQNKTKNIIIPSGEFVIDKPIEITRDETEIYGCGSSRIKASEDNFTGASAVVITGEYTKMTNLNIHVISDNHLINGLYIDGFNAYVDNSKIAGTGNYGIYINKAEARIYNTKVRGFNNGILVESPDAYFEDIFTEQNEQNGFIAHTGSIEAHHIHSYYNGTRGFYMSNASHSNFYGLYADKNGGTSFELRNCGSCNFIACWAYYTGRTTNNSYGWQVVECNDTNFIGCKCQGDQSGTLKSWILYHCRSNLYGCTAENTNYEISGDNLNSFYSCAGYLSKLNGVDRSSLLIPQTTIVASTTTAVSVPLGKLASIQDYNTRNYIAKINFRSTSDNDTGTVIALITVGKNAGTNIEQLNQTSRFTLSTPAITETEGLSTLTFNVQNLTSKGYNSAGLLESNLTVRAGL